mmetsp:Transcript_50999/g.120754  ORF Transcript_50999/g.120754 Transcript_50999/m.120754 type:complete len:398 (+) Transcript_50999:1157-2350(+)
MHAGAEVVHEADRVAEELEGADELVELGDELRAVVLPDRRHQLLLRRKRPLQHQGVECDGSFVDVGHHHPKRLHRRKHRVVAQPSSLRACALHHGAGAVEREVDHHRMELEHLEVHLLAACPLLAEELEMAEAAGAEVLGLLLLGHRDRRRVDHVLRRVEEPHDERLLEVEVHFAHEDGKVVEVRHLLVELALDHAQMQRLSSLAFVHVRRQHDLRPLVRLVVNLEPTELELELVVGLGVAVARFDLQQRQVEHLLQLGVDDAHADPCQLHQHRVLGRLLGAALGDRAGGALLVVGIAHDQRPRRPFRQVLSLEGAREAEAAELVHLDVEGILAVLLRQLHNVLLVRPVPAVRDPVAGVQNVSALARVRPHLPDLDAARRLVVDGVLRLVLDLAAED